MTIKMKNGENKNNVVLNECLQVCIDLVNIGILSSLDNFIYFLRFYRQIYLI